MDAMRHLGVLGAVVPLCAGALLPLPVAEAATVYGKPARALSGQAFTLIVFEDVRGERNDLTVSYANDRLRFVDRRSRLHARRPCRRPSPHVVTCRTRSLPE